MNGWRAGMTGEGREECEGAEEAEERREQAQEGLGSGSGQALRQAQGRLTMNGWRAGMTGEGRGQAQEGLGSGHWGGVARLTQLVYTLGKRESTSPLSMSGERL